ncbi:Zn(II)2Cys6 transcription factor domain-containing protein [Aspergillus lucknowensis]|uniref:Zn(2)-C6 fungal-type domain-containing protein n=1 Tax=Aspergillus lucknowensis TaxID=176173 RepID=A0ABR4LQR4_9EURO
MTPPPTTNLPPVPAPPPPATTSTNTSTEKEKPSKPRPITSCSACRIRKVKCDRASPCASCVARHTPNECTYATTTEEREAIAAADLIAELRATRNKLQGQLAKSTSTMTTAMGTATATSGLGLGSSGSGSGSDSGFRAGYPGEGNGNGNGNGNGEDEDAAALEAVYAVLRRGSWEVAREVVGRIRGGEGVKGVLGGMDGAAKTGVDINS